MLFDKKLLDRLCNVARLNLTDEEKLVISKDLSEVLDAFSKIESFKSGINSDILVSPCDHEFLRDDKVSSKKLNLKFDGEDNFVVGPKLK
ncbi:MAG: Asp-tRNA(Asn)/Glu-tRNA(Gln) amidotransferase subunit GatC [Candidatus Woesearchaeota archaeon]